MEQTLTQRAKDIIEKNQYLTIASVSPEGEVWASALCYAFDDKYNFYWVSLPSSRHQRNIQYNPRIVFTIFDSRQSWGEGIGLQIEATVEQVASPELLLQASSVFFSRKYPYGQKNLLSAYGNGLKALLKDKTYTFYKGIPTKVWFPDPDADIDARVVVSLI